jgi:hypothetical protein
MGSRTIGLDSRQVLGSKTIGLDSRTGSTVLGSTINRTGFLKVGTGFQYR